ncbi:MAG: hypothetical protein OXG60_09150 [Chloroflexi bacterium]|nr:hypothetical protein [Chloroflexota bacterium]
MTLKRFTLVLALLALLTAGVSAQDDTSSYSFSRISIRHGAFVFSLDDPTLLEATGLDAEALRTALMDGATIAELIQANEGDVTAVVADMKAQATEDINARAASFLEGLEERVNEELNAGHSRRGFWGRRWHRSPRIFGYPGVSDMVMEATGLDAAGLRSALAEGSTIAELIEANEGDLMNVAADIVATITDAVNAAAAQRADSLEGDITEAFDSNFAEKWRRWRRFPKPRGFFGSWGSDSMSSDVTSEAADG